LLSTFEALNRLTPKTILEFLDIQLKKLSRFILKSLSESTMTNLKMVEWIM